MLGFGVSTTTTKPFVSSIWGRLHEPKENYVESGTLINFLHSFLSSNVFFIKTFNLYILSYHLYPCFLRSPLHSFNLPLIRFTRRTGASVGLRRTWPNHRRRYSLLFYSIGVTSILVRIFSFLTLSLLVLPHIQRSVRISATLIFWAWYFFIAQHSVSYNKAGLKAVW